MSTNQILFRNIILAFLLGLSLKVSAQTQLAISVDLSSEVNSLNEKSINTDFGDLAALPILSKASFQKHLSLSQDQESLKLKFGPGASSYILLEDLEIALGDEIQITDSRGNEWFFQRDDISTENRLIAGPTEGDVEITVGESQNESQNKFRIKQIYVAPVNVGAMELGFGASYECHININCDEGKDFSDEKSGVMRIRMVAEEGVALCTGTLLNNVSEDRDPLVLTAFHCLRPGEGTLTPLFDMWFFDFNYEGQSCANPDEEPGVMALQGAEILSEWEDTDMMLLRIKEEIPENSTIYFNGWDRRESHQPQKSVLIHHPSGDIKKITTDFDQVIAFDKTIGWNNSTVTPAFSHYINDFDDAVYQPGSSGAGLFDGTGKVIGQLHGGPLSDEFCTIGIGYSGRLSQSWESGLASQDRLQPWLDPDNTGATSMEGMSASSSAQFVQFEGTVVTTIGIALPGVRVELSGDSEASLLTGSDGRFVFDNLSTDGQYKITLSKNSNPPNGISALDIILLQNHILGRKSIEDVFSRFAGDVNKDGNISSLDIVQIINILVGRRADFPNSDSWNFEPNMLEVGGNNVGAGSIELNIIGYKMGDINSSANPRL
ncbi:MAG: hypothetical protein ACI9FN_000588 [Saprospiraceae bacterium]|jgi:hypothetical protein